MSVMSFRRACTAAVAMGVGVAAFAAPVSASADPPSGPPCWGSGCVGGDPGSINGPSCANDATTVASIVPPGGGPTISLRWSSYCQANWALTDDPGANYWDGRWWAETYDGKRAYGSWPILYTEMVDGSQLARVCVVPVAYPLDDPICTGWY